MGESREADKPDIPFWKRLGLSGLCMLLLAPFSYILQGAFREWGVFDPIARRLGEVLALNISASLAGWTAAATVSLGVYGLILWRVWGWGRVRYRDRHHLQLQAETRPIASLGIEVISAMPPETSAGIGSKARRAQSRRTVWDVAAESSPAPPTFLDHMIESKGRAAVETALRPKFVMPLIDVLKRIAFASEWAVTRDFSSPRDHWQETMWEVPLAKELMRPLASDDIPARGIRSTSEGDEHGHSDIPASFWLNPKLDIHADRLLLEPGYDFVMNFAEGFAYHDIRLRSVDVNRIWPARSAAAIATNPSPFVGWAKEREDDFEERRVNAQLEYDRQRALIRADRARPPASPLGPANRAFIGTMGAALFGVDSPKSMIVIDIKNFGKTPAYNVRWKANAGWSEKQPGSVDGGGEGVIGITEPGHAQNITLILNQPVRSRDIAKFERDGKGIYAVARIDYDDADGEPHTRRIAYYVDPEGHEWPDRRMLSVCSTGNDEISGRAHQPT